MTHKEKTVITIETIQRTTMQLRRKAETAWCEHCQAETVRFAPDKADADLDAAVREIFRLAESGEFQFFESESGELLVCRDSCRSHES